MQKNGKTGAAKSEADKAIERSNIEERKKAKVAAHASKMKELQEGKKQKNASSSQSWHYPEHWQTQDWTFEGGSWKRAGNHQEL